MLIPLISLVLLWTAAAQPAGTHLEPATDDAYDMVSRIDVDDSVVAVVRRNGVLHLLYDETIIGAEFDDPYLRKQTAFPGFTIMQCAAYLERKPTKALQIGLGIGSVPSFLREMDIPTDVVEISEAVVTQAADYFQYEWCEEDECPQGRTVVMDGLKFLASKPEDLDIETDTENPYDLFIVDVYTGWNPFAFFVREEMLRVRENWLTTDGVLVMNFVGYMQDPRAAAPKSIYRTLQSVFKYVKCFREMEAPDEPEAANIVFYASDKLFDFNLPSTGMYKDPPAHTFFSVVKNFPKWEIFTDLKSDVEVAIHQEMDDEQVRFVASNDDTQTATSAAPRVLTEADHGQKDFREIHAETQAHMRQRVLDQFPAALWEEFKHQKSNTE
ncbi:putative S-adenosyl-L-methionine-dependent methyltransferase [Phytophthora infestans]|uniref:Putative S-adenosyl-L-methionine-dependent methyltransferase n=1 Tax=Phytophthora infestans TaxID=4787 RepID=A0A833WFE2_PHYIN|nr:putative S-adenosyl-L-methionine-dependent methyltransferase [Phytophthora infestans]KAF4150301.1 putative S-adenosyl-L-methionine-dependent methyltransferase [Phytophthora infestans]KAI9996914.1 hypothetical protein PInf_000181 [Phytophthora infestans]